MKDPSVVDILLVEDNPQDAELMIRAIRKRNLMNPIYVVEDGAEALDFIFCRGSYAGRDFSKPPKVVLLDLKLPKVGGIEVLRAAKADQRTRHIPIVVVTSSREDPDIRTAYTLGANSYVVKPVDFSAFMDAMSNLGLYWLLVNQPPR
ncbi:MAG TPA: response regulator [Smithellaceae bacterium]|nr:response regulator [Smithellaceae bacterium]HRV45011.1 response regulator [Smithellaceae bacterium]